MQPLPGCHSEDLGDGQSKCKSEQNRAAPQFTGGTAPDVLEAARTVSKAGCHGITVHPRPDGRHIRRSDVLDLTQMLTVEFNIEGYPSLEFLDLVCQVRPTQCTLVPDPPDAVTSNAGWDLISAGHDSLREVLTRLRDHGIRTSLFLEADVRQVPRAAPHGADWPATPRLRRPAACPRPRAS